MSSKDRWQKWTEREEEEERSSFMIWETEEEDNGS